MRLKIVLQRFISSFCKVLRFFLVGTGDESYIQSVMLIGWFSKAVIGASLVCCCWGYAENVEGATVSVDEKVDWPSFMSRNDLVWEAVPAKWEHAPFLGNGLVGLMVIKDGDNKLRFDVGRGDVQENRELKIDPLFARGRVPIGKFVLETKGKITGADWRLDLLKAELRGELKTDAGSVLLRAYVHADHPLIVLEATPKGGEMVNDFEWVPAKAISPRWVWQKKPAEGTPDYPNNPDGKKSVIRDVSVWEQPLLPQGVVTTAWAQKKQGSMRRLFASVLHGQPARNATRYAVALADAASRKTAGALEKTHQAWWKNYYRQAFVSLPDAYWESFYWTQMYKLASAGRDDGMLIDTIGPWLQPTSWCGTWWNLNIQLSYWPSYVGNRLCVAESLRRGVFRNRENFINAVPEKYRGDSAAVRRCTGQDGAGAVGYPGNGKGGLDSEVGNLLWVCHNLWLHYRVTMNESILEDDVYPLLRRCVNYYLHFIEKGPDGKWHIPRTHSPEYGESYDANYDLALLKWGCQTLIKSAKVLNMNDPLLNRWKDVEKNLVPYPKDDKGYRIGRDTQMTFSHRHFSHLLMIFPLQLVDPEDPEEADLIRRSLAHWHSFKGGLQGYSFTGGSLIASMLGDGEKSYDYLNGLRRYVTPTSMYSEGGGPVIETPLSAAESIHQMLLQSGRGVIKVFPAMPAAWNDSVFRDLRAEGGFMVSARREGGENQWILIKSLAGEPCRVAHGFKGKVSCEGAEVRDLGKGVVSLNLPRGKSCLLYSGAKPTVISEPIKQSDAPNPLGLKKK